MFTPRRDSLPSPSLEDSFFPLSSSSSSSLSLSMVLPSSSSSSSPLSGQAEEGGAVETDLILAAELGQALLERNEELAATLDEREREMEALQQEKHVLQRRLEVSELASSQKEAELTSDLTSLRAELDRHHSRGRDRRRDESEQLTQLANHNHRLVEQLAEAVTVEHTLRSELRALREEMDDSSFSRNISSTQLENARAENRVVQERLSHMEKQLRASYEDSDRLRGEREAARERLKETQSSLREREAEAKEALLAHSEALQAREKDVHTLREKLSTTLEELESLRDELKHFTSGPGKPSYSSLESEAITLRKERDSLNQQLLNTIKHKVALSQEVDAWQEDMRLVICQQVQLQEEERQQEKIREKEREKAGLQRGTRTSRSMKVRGEGRKGFFSSLFGGES